MHIPIKTEEHKIDQRMADRFAKVGAKIDELIVKAAETRDEVKLKLDELKLKQEATVKKGEAALDEFKSALDNAWDELNQAWKEIKEGTERAAQKFRS